MARWTGGWNMQLGCGMGGVNDRGGAGRQWGNGGRLGNACKLRAYGLRSTNSSNPTSRNKFINKLSEYTRISIHNHKHTRAHIRTIAKPNQRNARSMSIITIIKYKPTLLCKIHTYCPNSENHPSPAYQEIALDLLRCDTSHRCQHIQKTNQMFPLISQFKM